MSFDRDNVLKGEKYDKQIAAEPSNTGKYQFANNSY